MQNQPEQPQTTPSQLSRVEEARFSSDMEALIKDAEDRRLRFMRQFKSREMLAMSLGLIVVLLGGAGFGWFLLVEANLIKAVACVILTLALPLTMHLWTGAPIKAYIKDHKENFMPELAKTLGGFRFFPSRGISANIISKTAIIPNYDSYEAEDCFMGMYKGVKVIMSEARLHKKKSRVPLFHGIFILLEIPEKILEGHTIITANKKMVARYETSRWKKLTRVSLPHAGRFNIFSSKPEEAPSLAGEKFLKELSEAADIFENSPLTAVFFRGKYIFLSIPYGQDMFEASNIYMPVTTKKHALTCRKEIQQILEIIDVFEIYQTNTEQS